MVGSLHALFHRPGEMRSMMSRAILEAGRLRQARSWDGACRKDMGLQIWKAGGVIGKGYDVCTGLTPVWNSTGNRQMSGYSETMLETPGIAQCNGVVGVVRRIVM